MTVSAAGTPPANGLAATADRITRAADALKQPIGAFAEASPRRPQDDLRRAMTHAADYLRGEGTADGYAMATALGEFARRLLGEEGDNSD